MKVFHSATFLSAIILSACLFIGGGVSTASAEAPRALPAGEFPQDQRLGPKKDLNGYFPFAPSPNPEAWAKRAERVRRQIQVATGLWPMPERTPVNVVVHGKVEREGYTVERVILESVPGHFVTGSLYRPTGRTGKLPGMLCPHGHWPNGRFFDHGEQEIKNQIATGAERFEVGGRYPLQARCVQLARMGCVVFHYDMIGYADSLQLEHRAGVREQMNTPENWGFFSPQAELRLQGLMGLQTYNSVRALDWLSELPDVDPTRIGVTGASGGGTQTFILAAVDPRPALSFPAVMVSTAMQGGCACENAEYLRVGTGNIEIAGLFAPKPLGMTAADDWTKEILTKGLPELKQHYAMLGVPDLVMAASLTQFPHNYNNVSRMAMYSWVNKHFKLGLPEPIIEQDYKPLSIEELTVWDASHPKPPAGDDYERSLVKSITESSNQQIASLMPKDEASLAKYREVIGGAVDVMIGRGLPEAGTIQQERVSKHDRGDCLEIVSILKNPSHGEVLPALFLYPKTWNRKVVVWLDEQGKAGLYGSDGSLKPDVQKLVSAGTAVAGVDLLHQGEFQADGQPLSKTTLVRTYDTEWGKYAAYTFGYNHPLFSSRVQDVLSVLSFVRNYEDKPEQVYLFGTNGVGPIAAAAAAQAGAAVDRVAVDTAGFRFAKLTAFDDPNFLPGAVKYGDLPAMLALSTSKEIWLAGEGAETPPLLAAAQKAAGQGATTSIYSGAEEGEVAAAVDWLLK